MSGIKGVAKPSGHAYVPGESDEYKGQGQQSIGLHPQEAGKRSPQKGRKNGKVKTYAEDGLGYAIGRAPEKKISNHYRGNASPAVPNRPEEDEKQHLHLEDIFHQLRALVSVFAQYDSLASRESPYLLNNMSHVAISFATAVSGKQIQDTLRYQLNEMEIPGITLLLSDNMTSDLSAASVEFLIPEPPADIRAKLPYKVYDPAHLPKIFLPQGHRYTAMLELLYHADKYFGYAFLEMGNPNIAVYDAIRMLLSNALYSVFMHEGRTSERNVLISSEQLTGILHLPPESKGAFTGGLTGGDITNYLIEHLNEMTNLEQMAADLHISKSHLVRRAKELTGYTIQTLHEKLKIEQAKNLLQVENLKLSEIASRLGFQNQNYFSAVFKKNTGLSPRSWAKRPRG